MREVVRVDLMHTEPAQLRDNSRPFSGKKADESRPAGARRALGSLALHCASLPDRIGRPELDLRALAWRVQAILAKDERFSWHIIIW
ncbi:hypothetical protein [Polyangium jinanense]|uniref:hypothetical protein n=1 Tax=Polyangium jinanense TaxID=2829994 RepID=UPI002342310D|nr:hypothetical protein [Polyangium jinanense]